MSDKEKAATLSYHLSLSLISSTLFRLPVNCQIGVGVKARFVKIYKLGGFGLGQLFVLNALRDETTEAVMQEAALVARALDCLAD